MNQNYSDDLQQISEEEYYTNTYIMFNKQTINCTDFNQLCYYTNYLCCPTSNQSALIKNQLNPINFNALDEMETESELSQDVEQISDQFNNKIQGFSDIHNQQKFIMKNQEFLPNGQKLNDSVNNNVREQILNFQEEASSCILKDSAYISQPIIIEQESDVNEEKFILSKKKSINQKNGQINKEEEGQNLTQYQKKKIMIQQMRDANILLDWDNYKREELLYEYTHVQGGAQRRKKGKYSEIDIIYLPNPNFESKTNLPSSTNLAKGKEKEIKRYKVNSKSSTQDLPQNINSANFSSNDSDTIENADIKKNNKLIKEKEEPIIEMIEVDQEELKKRQQDFKEKGFKLGRCTIPCNVTLVSSRVQAIIPQIRPVEEAQDLLNLKFKNKVRKTWVLQDLDQLLQFKNTPEYNSLEQHMNQAFGVRKPEEIFNILKLNNYNLKAAIDYCNFQRDYLLAIYKNREEIEKKKRMINKRKLEKRNYI